MNAFQKYKPLLAALIAANLAAVAAPLLADVGGTPVTATEQPALPGTGPNPGDNLRAQMQGGPGVPTAPLTGDAIHSSFGAPLIARGLPAAPGTGPNSGDLVRADMQDDRTSFAAIGTGFPLQPGAGSVANVDPGNADLHGRGGWNPALVELQATPKPFPWDTRMANKAPRDQSAKVEAKP